MKILTVATNEEGYYQALKESINFEFVTLGMNMEWKGLTMKIDLIRDYINLCKDDEIIIIVDGYDVICLESREEIERRFLLLKSDIVFGVNIFIDNNRSWFFRN